uniref:Protein deadpan n=1 Tax=Schistosoma haematobium TaxID=6185 RepID=A0A094ZV51_SCHHA
MYTSTPYTNHRSAEHSTISNEMDISNKIQFNSNLNGTQTSWKKRNKPLVEKRRRQRINHALDELRRLIIEPRIKHSNKLEKADILDMTVKFIKDLTTNFQLDKYQTIFQESQQIENIRMFYYGYLSCESTFKSIIQKHFDHQQSTSSTMNQMNQNDLININNELYHSKQFTILSYNTEQSQDFINSLISLKTTDKLVSNRISHNNCSNEMSLSLSTLSYNNSLEENNYNTDEDHVLWRPW